MSEPAVPPARPEPASAGARHLRAADAHARARRTHENAMVLYETHAERLRAQGRHDEARTYDAKAEAEHARAARAAVSERLALETAAGRAGRS